MKFNSYFTGRYILSKQALFNIVFSDRSDGKTFDCKSRALEDYEKDKSITVYMRRYKTEITSKLYNNFFNEVLDITGYERFKKWQFKGSKVGVQVKLPGETEWDWIIYFVPLSIASKLKSQISDVLRIKTIDYDEYIPLDLKYLPNEMNLLIEFWKSIDRDRDTTQLIILGNRITPFTPIFDYFGINIQISKENLRLYKNDTIAVQIYVNKEHREIRQKGRFRQMISGTEYEQYDRGGVLNALNVQIKSRVGFEYWCSFKTERGEGSIWYKNGELVISEYLRKDNFIITDKIYGIKNRQEYLCNYGRFGRNFKAIYKRGGMFFETEKAFYYFEKILEKLGNM